MSTALELPKEEWKQYAESVKKRASQPAPAIADRTARRNLLRQIDRVAVLLKSQFHVQQVILFGSLAHEGWFDPDSDVDLAVKGLQGEDYWRAWREVEEIIRDREVDLIEIESASESLQRAIERYGVEL